MKRSLARMERRLPWRCWNDWKTRFCDALMKDGMETFRVITANRLEDGANVCMGVTDKTHRRVIDIDDALVFGGSVVEPVTQPAQNVFRDDIIVEP